MSSGVPIYPYDPSHPLPPLPQHLPPLPSHQHQHSPHSPSSYNPFARSANHILHSPQPTFNPYALPPPPPSHPQQGDDMSRRSSSRVAEHQAQQQYQQQLQQQQYHGTGAYSTRRASRGASSTPSLDPYAHQHYASGSATRRSARAHAPVTYDEDALLGPEGGDDDAEGEQDDADGSFDQPPQGQPVWDAQQPPRQQQNGADAYPAAQGAEEDAPGDDEYKDEGADEDDEDEEPVRRPTGIKIKFTNSAVKEDEDGGLPQPPPQAQEGYYPPIPAGEEGAAGGADGEYVPAAGAGGEDDEEEEQIGRRTRFGASKRGVIAGSSDEEEDDSHAFGVPRVTTTTSSGRQTRRPAFYGESDDEGAAGAEGEEGKPAAEGGRRGLRRGGAAAYGGDYVEPDPEYDDAGSDGAYGEPRRPRRSTRASTSTGGGGGRLTRGPSRRQHESTARPKGRTTRNSRRASAADQSYEGGGSSDVSTDEEMLDLANDSEEEDDDGVYAGDRGGAPAKRQLRNKPRINYFTPLALEATAAKKDGKGKEKRRRGPDEDGNPFAGLPANMTGADWARLYPEGGQPSDSDSDDDLPNLSSPRKNPLFSGPGALAGGSGGMLAGGGMDFGSGAPNNMGKVSTAAALADTDPLGVPQSISFSSVGGLQSHIQQLKEMVSLPLLYPEVFERFAITPPRGVLFHGPPGTGKTLLARALAASCSTEGRKISFFMRKGADCLSKWVGEAERQLRLLFEEARACQPSIIFFDEIDGLAPVRSSKQEQIHASIVSTLLALMDGMDGRGQVIVIGATNRPDAIDPALRRPGRFDREFYFPLPNREARRTILGIHTQGWNPPLEEGFMDELAKITKGYGGADLRALCTEAALNAVQRTYPQIYKTNDRLLIKPENIEVTARDFTISQKNLIPSTARSTSSAAAPLPRQLVPLLSDALENAKQALARVLPDTKKVNILDEAEYVDEGAGFEKEKMLQAFESQRVFRPRLLICGERGMGQAAVGAAVLHHLEGFHVQTLDLATLVSDSTRTMEAACVQLFVEAKRHRPSILFIPQLGSWCASVGETVRATISGLLDGLDPSDPILLLAVVEGEVKDLPADVRGWFGFVKKNRVVLGKPGPDQRRSFFADVLSGLRRPPSEYPDGLPRRRRILEKLPIAPPPPPRAPTAAEIAQQDQNDLRLLEYLKWKLGPVLAELKKRYKRFTRSYYRDWQSDDLEWRQEQLKRGQNVTGLGTQPYHNVDLDSMHSDLYKGFYYTPDDFVTDILRIQHNAEVNKIMENDAEAPVRAGQMVNHTKVMMDQVFDLNFCSECDKMAGRMREKDEKNPKRKGKGKGGDVAEEGAVLATAKEAAVAGGLNARHHRPTPNGALEGVAEETGEEGDVQILGENGAAEPGAVDELGNPLKRPREDGAEGEDAEMDGLDGEGAPKRLRQGSAGFDPQTGEQAAVDLVDGQAVASGSNGGALNGFPAATASAANGLPPSANAFSLNDLLNPTSSSSSSLTGFGVNGTSSHDFAAAPASASEPAVQQQPNPFVIAPGSGVGVPVPMPVGAVPPISPQHPSAAAIAAPGSISFLTGPAAAGSSTSARNPFSPAPGSANGNGALQVNGTASAATLSREATPTPSVVVNGVVQDQSPIRLSSTQPQTEAEKQQEQDAQEKGKQPEEKERTPTPMEETPPPPPPFVLPDLALDALESALVDRTAPLSVEQLEQLRAACFDTVWRARSEWDRTRAVDAVRELVDEFVDEVEEVLGSA